MYPRDVTCVCGKNFSYYADQKCQLSTAEMNLYRVADTLGNLGLCKVRMWTADADGGCGWRTADGGKKKKKIHSLKVINGSIKLYMPRYSV